MMVQFCYCWLISTQPVTILRAQTGYEWSDSCHAIVACGERATGMATAQRPIVSSGDSNDPNGCRGNARNLWGNGAVSRVDMQLQSTYGMRRSQQWCEAARLGEHPVPTNSSANSPMGLHD